MADEYRVVRVRPGKEAEYIKETGGMTPFTRQTWPYRGRMMEALRAEWPGYVLTKEDTDEPATWHKYADSEHWCGFLPGKVTPAEMKRILDGLDENNVRLPREPEATREFVSGDLLLIKHGHYAGHTLLCDYQRGEKLHGYLQTSGQSLYMRAEWCVIQETESLRPQ